MEQLQIPVGELCFDALADGPNDGELVLLLHGFPQSSWQWRAQLPALADAGYRAVAVDQRGYSPGARPDGVEHYAMRHLVADVVAVADWLGGHRFHLGGHDFGAVVGWFVAGGRYAERVRTLTAVSVPHPAAVAGAMKSPSGDQRSRSGYIAFFRQPEAPEHVLLADEGSGLRALFANTGYVERAAMERYVALLTEPGAVTAALNWYRANGLDVLAELGPVSAPTLFVWGTDEPTIGPEAAEGGAAHAHGPYRFEALDGVGHWVPEEAADLFNRLLLDHLAGGGEVQ
jgi:pimeloyl-ACP methyl ester carboxylesterase